jgi:hypothetical protein
VWQVSRGGCKIAWGAVLVQGSPRRGIARRLQERGNDQEQDDATERLASAVSKRMFGHSLTEGEKASAGTTYHYGLGSLACRVYGMVAENLLSVTACAGMALDAVVWLTADEATMLALDLSKSPMGYPLCIYAYSLASHLIFGLTAEQARRAVRVVLCLYLKASRGRRIIVIKQ